MTRDAPAKTNWLLYGGKVVILAVVIVGALQYGWFTAAAFSAWAATEKIRGNAAGCSWPMIATMYRDMNHFGDTVERSRNNARRLENDEEANLELIKVGDRRFWAPSEEHDDGARVLISYLVAEHDFAANANADSHVRAGDIVLDCGAHVGVFTRKALELGAAKVIAIDPGPMQGESLRRNFAQEIAEGRVTIVTAGVWSAPGSMTMHLGSHNSGMGSLVMEHEGVEEIEVPVKTIDAIVAELALPRVDFIKMDIEGAEREALKGAAGTLARFRPRLMIDGYHRPDDMQVLPELLHQAHEDYRGRRSNCEVNDHEERRLSPHFVFYN